MPYDADDSGQDMFRSAVLSLPHLQPSKPPIDPRAVKAANRCYLEVPRIISVSAGELDKLAAIIHAECFGEKSK